MKDCTNVGGDKKSCERIKGVCATAILPRLSGLNFYFIFCLVWNLGKQRGFIIDQIIMLAYVGDL